MTEWKKVHDSRPERPGEIDTTSSTSTVYERRNIQQETREIGFGENATTYTEWVYEQREYTQEEFSQMRSPATQSIMQAISDLELSIASIGLETV